MKSLVTHQCKTGCDTQDTWIGLHRHWTLHAHVCISCSGDALYHRTRCSSNVHLKQITNHSPQGVETGDLRSSRHMPQVSSNMLTANDVPALSADDRARYCTVDQREMRRDAGNVTCTGLNSSTPCLRLTPTSCLFSKIKIIHTS